MANLHLRFEFVGFLDFFWSDCVFSEGDKTEGDRQGDHGNNEKGEEEG